jgi:2-deoxy-D-gluconate 3-dehydrogenase
MTDLTGKRALVTGASRGIGRAIAAAYARAGADVALVARDEVRLAETAQLVETAGRRAVVVTADVTSQEAVQAAVATAVEQLGGLDIVVSNAGGNTFMSPVIGMRPSGWEKTLRLNLDSCFFVAQAVGPILLEQRSGSLINVSSVAGITAAPMMAHYSAAKAALISLTRSLALEWAWAGVRVNALVPGWIATDLTDFIRDNPDAETALIGRVPMQRWGQPEEIAQPAVFLASDASAFVTGQLLVADGGLSIT